MELKTKNRNKWLRTAIRVIQRKRKEENKKGEYLA